MRTRLTPLQSVILCDIDPGERKTIERILKEHGIKLDDELSLLRRYAIACPAFPTCGLSITESERVMPQLIDSLEAEMARIGLAGERIAIHMTGCPNGCARPYSPEIGFVGKTLGKYTIYRRRQCDWHAARLHLQGSRPVRRNCPVVAAPSDPVQGRSPKRRIIR